MIQRLSLFTLSALPLVASLAQPRPAPTPLPPRPNEATWCQGYRIDGGDKTPPTPPARYLRLREISVVERRAGSRQAPVLKPVEQVMIQLALLYTAPEAALLPLDAVRKFFELDSNVGTGGAVTYYEATNIATNKRTMLAVATHFPGDNEFGMIYQVTVDTNPAKSRAMPIGAIHDGDVSCHDTAH